MKQFLSLLVVFTCLTMTGMGQSISAKTRIREAQKSYHIGQYNSALTKLEQAEKAVGKVNFSILYWRILTQRALLPSVKDPAFYTNMKKFEELEILRENCSIYLKTYGKLAALNEQSNKVYQVQQSLKGYPVAKVEFDEIMHLQNAIKSNH
ncbi:hypothetical protein [Pedobacter foliorum]|uniref:hypothetical protein n=1 Tax=Pedobacter foliorum TaxID=2739058 RepID=UPI0015633F9D|nr:hypothetical protein [Pedobacter foliorum]NRF41493.1 hypothetical protein [Pedobacter foliorum]